MRCRAFLLCKAFPFGTITTVGITARQFEAMQQRIRDPRSVSAPPTRSATGNSQIILGIDPSLRGTGFGVIAGTKAQPQALAFGTIACPAGWPASRCLVKIAEQLRRVIRENHPTVCAVEGIFFAQNIQTALIMGQARGAVLLAAAEAGLPIFEIAPRKVKQAVVGYGAAQKMAVAKMVQRMLHLAELPDPDAADALAVALAHTHENQGYPLTLSKPI